MQQRFTLFFLLCTSFLFAQQVTYMDVPFIHDRDQPLQHALVGGLDNAQFAEMDLNNDGILDLFIFDRVGNLPLTFINGGTPNVSDYTFAPAYAKNFPTNLRNWVVPRDYNCDGIMDLFAHSTVPGIDGIEVHRGVMRNDSLAFEKVLFPQNNNDIIYFPLNNGGTTQLYVSSIDYPAIDDLDNDGDLDILTFNPGGGYIELYNNQSMEQGFGCDSLHFNFTDDCWGGIYESGITEELNTASSQEECATPYTDGGVDERHSGSSLLTIDIDNDGDKEVILGDLAFDNFVIAINGGSSESAWIVDQDVRFPSNTEAADITVFPTPYSLDVDNDGVRDLIGTPSVRGRGENFLNVWFYKNIGTNELPNYEFQTKRFLVDEMVEVGSSSHPVFVDYNQDGLQDLIVANEDFYSNSGVDDSRFFLYENIGTAEAPVFKLIDENYLNFQELASTTFNLTPTFGDLDSDGDLDLLVGDNFGRLFYLENTGGAGNPMAFDNGFTYEYMGIDVGLAATPQIIDLNQDGLMDIVVGERGGNNGPTGACGTLNYFQNIGTPTEPMFEGDEEVAPNSNCLGHVFTIPPNGILSYSVPVFWEFEDHIELFVGTNTGGIKRYDNLAGNIYGDFTEISNDILGMDIGERIYPTIADINNDGFLDFFIGNARGGLSAFTTDIFSGVEVNVDHILPEHMIQLYPNPARDQFTLDLSKIDNNNNKMVEIYNVQGQRIVHNQVVENQLVIVTENWTTGLYLVRIEVDGKWLTKKLIIE